MIPLKTDDVLRSGAADHLRIRKNKGAGSATRDVLGFNRRRYPVEDG